MLFSPSGSGKTSLIQAGVRPQLEKLGYKTIYTRMENEPIPSLCHAVAGELDIPVGTVCGQQPDLHDFLEQAAAQAGKPLVIFLDQFEEFFIVYRERPDLRAEFVRQVARIRQDDSLHVFLVLSLREDYFASLHEFSEAIPSIFQNNANIRLKPFTDEAARRAVEEPLKAVGFSIEEGLTDLLIGDLKKTHNREEKDLSKTLVDPAAQPDPCIEPIKLQIVCSELWNRRDETHSRIFTAAYKAAGGVDSIVNRFIMKRLKKVSWTRRKLMERIFNALKTPDNTKRYHSFEDLTAQLNIKRKKHFKKLLGQLEELDILRREERGGTSWYEFLHDYLVREVVRWMEERREKRNRRRLIIEGLPGVIFFIIIFIYLYMQNNTYYLSFSTPEYEGQREEIIFSPGFNPFQEQIGTGYFSDDLKDAGTINSINEKIEISSWSKNIWKDLGDKLEESKEWYYLYHIGQSRAIIDTLKEELKTKISKNARSIFELIAKHDRTAFSVLYRSLSDDDRYIRFQSALALVNIGKEDQTATEILYTALNDLDWEVRSSAAQALVNLGKTDSRIIDVLIQALNDKDSNWVVRISAADALVKLDKTDSRVINALIQALKDKDSTWEVRSFATQALVKFGKTDSSVIDALVQALKDKDSDVSTSVARALGNIGKPDTGVIEALKDALQDSDSLVRISAANALVKLDKTDDRVIDVLVQGLKDRDSFIFVQSFAVESLGNIGKPNPGAIEALKDALKNSRECVRPSVVEALGKIGKLDRGVIEALTEALKDSNQTIRFSAAYALGNIGKSDPGTIKTLKDTLKDLDSNVRYSAADALVKLGKTDKRVIDVLVQTLKDSNSDVRSYAAYVLGNIGKLDPGVIEGLKDALKNSSERVHFSISYALAKLGKTDKRVIDVLVQKLNYERAGTDLRSSAVQSLEKIGKPEKIIIEALMAALKYWEANIRSSAAKALGNLFQSQTDIQLLYMLQHNDSGYRKAAAYALAAKNKKNPLSKEILQKIADSRTQDPHPWVKLAAWDAFYLLHEEKEGTIDD
ncbi:MAG: HEAT repeat domain-containing protein [Candidatus Aminicenantes bacterium]|nr:HEAT repeat domain-containing protein [Candidatus Aminicenantes bacterium]